MRDDVKSQSSSAGSAGAQGSFLDECWEFAHPTRLGARGSTGAQDEIGPSDERSRAPERSHGRRERCSPRETGDSAARSRAPAEANDTSADWGAAAQRLLATCPDRAIQHELTGFYVGSAAALEHDRGLARHEAEQQAFGLLMFELLRRCAAARSVSTEPHNDEEASA